MTNYAYTGEPATSVRLRAMQSTGTRAARKFCDIGYTTVTTVQNQSSIGTLSAIESFVAGQGESDQLAIYFIGHGKQFGGVPHLLGVDYDVDRPATAAMGLSIHALYRRVMPLLNDRTKGNLIVFVDACRDDDEPSVSEANFLPGRSDGPLYASRRIWVAYATQPGSLAEGNDGSPGEPTTAFFRQWSNALADRAVRNPEHNNWTYVVQLAGERLAANGHQYPLVVGGWPGFVLANPGPVQARASSEALSWLPRQAGRQLLFDRPTKFLSWDRTGSTWSDRDRKVNQGFDAALGLTSGYPDHARAEQLWTEAAEAGSSVAAHNLGVLAYYYSDAWALAKQWFERGWRNSLEEFGASGLTPTQTDLAYILALGPGGLPVDQGRALELFRRSAQAGDPDAMAWLAHLLDDRNDFVAAQKWRARAMMENEPSSFHELALLHDRAQGQNGQEDERVRALMEFAALQGDRDVQSSVGTWYINNGRCSEGLRHLNAAARNGDRAAASQLRNLQSAGACLPSVDPR